MIRIPGYEHRRIAVMGLGVAGLPTVRALRASGARVLAWVDTEPRELETTPCELSVPKGATVELTFAATGYSPSGPVTAEPSRQLTQQCA